MTVPPRLNLQNAAQALGISPATFYRWLADPEAGLADLAHTSPAGRRYWLPDELEAWVRSRCFATEGTQP